MAPLGIMITRQSSPNQVLDGFAPDGHPMACRWNLHRRNKSNDGRESLGQALGMLSILAASLSVQTHTFSGLDLQYSRKCLSTTFSLSCR